MSDTKKYVNDERTVKCPVEGCDSTPLARGVHLHIMRSNGNGHGDQGNVPSDVTLDNLETVGEKKVEMDYPEDRKTESVARMCPYCQRPFRGSHGVMIHLGQMAGRKNHPEDAAERQEPEDLPVVHVDENENVIEVVEGDQTMPSTDRRRDDENSLDNDAAKAYVNTLRAEGKHEEADKAARMLGIDAD
jgi:hypothetical protein